MLMAKHKPEAPQRTANQPEKYFEDQFDDEEVLYVFRKHPVVMRVGRTIVTVTADEKDLADQVQFRLQD